MPHPTPFPLRPAAALTACALALAGVSTTAASTAATAAPPVDARARQYAAAAAASGVPDAVLLAVSYLESRWDTNGGAPSTSGGFGPMHLTDAALVASMPARFEGDASTGARGDDSRPTAAAASTTAPSASAPATADWAPPAAGSGQTVQAAAALTGTSAATLRTDPAANIRGGAALLASYQHDLGAPGGPATDPAQWYGAVARYSGAGEAGTAQAFADEVYATLASGMSRTTDDGHALRLAPHPGTPDRSWLDRLKLPRQPRGPGLECPRGVSCESIPAPYQLLGDGTDPSAYGNHDLSDRPVRQRVEYIVIHDTEVSYDETLKLVQDPTYVSWHYTVRSADGHIAQHVPTKDVAWHAGNWYVNAKAVGVEHEGFGAQASWYTEAMYRSSAKLVRYLALKLGVPLDRAHIIGHDNVPGTVPSTVAGMHWDPGPYWDWSHYFDLLGAPLPSTGSPLGGMVVIKPNFATNQPAFTGCDGVKGDPCPARGSSDVILRTAPSATAPLVSDIGLHPGGQPSTMDVSDVGAVAGTGQRFAVAGRSGDWTAIWYLGQRAWFYNPRSAPAAVWTTGLVVTPKAGLASVPVYGRAYPEAAAYPAGVPVQSVVPLQYTLLAGQRYSLAAVLPSEYYRASTFDGSSPGDWTVIRGTTTYAQIQFGHRVMYVNLADVRIVPATSGASG